MGSLELVKDIQESGSCNCRENSDLLREYPPSEKDQAITLDQQSNGKMDLKHSAEAKKHQRKEETDANHGGNQGNKQMWSALFGQVNQNQKGASLEYIEPVQKNKKKLPV